PHQWHRELMTTDYGPLTNDSFTDLRVRQVHVVAEVQKPGGRDHNADLFDVLDINGQGLGRVFPPDFVGEQLPAVALDGHLDVAVAADGRVHAENRIELLVLPTDVVHQLRVGVQGQPLGKSFLGDLQRRFFQVLVAAVMIHQADAGTLGHLDRLQVRQERDLPLAVVQPGDGRPGEFYLDAGNSCD